MTKLNEEKMCPCCDTTAAKCTCSPNCKGCDCNRNKVSEGLADMADMAERDHEVQMARADLYKIAKHAIKLHDMLKNVSEAEGIEGWQQAKITKAADYISSVYHALDYETNIEQPMMPEQKIVKKYKPTLAKEDIQSYKGSLAEKLNQKKNITEKKKRKMKGDDPCWTGYHMVGTKKKGGKEVPNCVPND